MKELSRGWALAASLALAATLAACGGGDGGGGTGGLYGGGGTTAPESSAPGASAPEDSSAPGEAAGPVTVDTAESELGTILVDGEGMTLYLFTNDSPGVSTCEGSCLANWPPLLGTPAAGDGADGSLLDTITRSDGDTQVTYNGWPLYYWVGDTAAGETNGQGVMGVWFVVDRDGDPIGRG